MNDGNPKPPSRRALQAVNADSPRRGAQQAGDSTQTPSVGSKPRVGISRCLLGEAVRYDGSHKRDPFLAETLSRFVEWMPICPEIEAGLGIPRHAMYLTGDPQSPRLLTVETHQDKTPHLAAFCESRLRELHAMHLDGYVFKSRSPSCGTREVPLYRHGVPLRKTGMGVFARAFRTAFPSIPVEDECALQNPLVRHHFLTRVFCRHRWSQFLHEHGTIAALEQFHRKHTLLILAHSPRHYQRLDRLIQDATSWSPALAHRYGGIFMDALTITATVAKHTRVLQQLARYLSPYLNRIQSNELAEAIAGYREGRLSLATPLTLMIHYSHRLKIANLAEQVYLNPYPRELMSQTLV